MSFSDEERKERKLESQRKYRARNIESVREYAREHYRRNPEVQERVKQCSRKWRQDHPEEHAKHIRERQKNRRLIDSEYREKKNRYSREWRRKNPAKTRVHDAVNAAVRSGKLSRPSVCSECGGGRKIEAYHYKGYAWEDRFEIVWLCTRCHRRAEMINN